MAIPRIAAIGVVFLALLSSSPTAAPEFSDWSAAVNLGPVVNSVFNDSSPALSKDRLSLYFQSNRPGGSGGSDIWVSQRSSVGEPWGTPVNLGAVVNSIADDATP